MKIAVVGAWSNAKLPAAQDTADLFNSAGIETAVAENVRSVVWDKFRMGNRVILSESAAP